MDQSIEQTPQVRPTRKQRELLTYIQEFVAQHGYGPSYREIMAGCGYTSVATVALHVGNLIKRGHLRKNGRSARSLEVVDAPAEPVKIQTNEVKPAEEKWLIEKIDYRFAQAEATPVVPPAEMENLHVLVGALKVLGLEGAASSFALRLTELRKRA